MSILGMTKAGQQLAAAQGKHIGRPKGLDAEKLSKVTEALVVRDDVRGFQFSLLNVVGGATHAQCSASRPPRVRRWLGLPRRLATDSVVRQPDAPTANAPGRMVKIALVASIAGTDVRGLQSAGILLRGEVWASKSLLLSGVLKLGVRRYYTLLGAAAEPFGDQVMWATGLGVGTASRPHGRFTYSLDVLHWFLAGSVKTAGRPSLYRLLIRHPTVAW